MKNKEKYHDEILEIASNASCVAVLKSSGKVVACSGIRCQECFFFTNDSTCQENCKRWFESEYEEYPRVDWSKVEVDTPILARDRTTDVWLRRYFAKYQDGRVYTWEYGKTSWSAKGTDPTYWKYAKLAEEIECDVPFV